ncbi:phospholipase A2 [Streptomyces sp. ID05-04B]|uniref:phospholipase A2 n=1 Tax=unclassified Streptomyces TaxID=2593676 RepID=UPI000D19D256|nr:MULTISPECIES: phospholipase A2 [unclassified Streptomyces]AVV44190.1 hypothetical protein C6376_24870 [Streptomyces sp. P3]MDX5566117.1 phospholipase A2 [Streptomyces sp. ID05-04B]
MSSTAFRRRATGFATAVLCGFGLLTAQASPASASTAPGVNATPFNEGDEYWDTDGCTGVKDSSSYFDFHHACKHHDGCYKFHWSDRATCDQWFRNDMEASCSALHANQACYAVARLYYFGVRAFGEVPWSMHNIEVSMGQFITDLQDLQNPR